MKFSNFLKFQKPLLCVMLALARSPALRAQAFAQGNVLNLHAAAQSSGEARRRRRFRAAARPALRLSRQQQHAFG